MGGEVAPVFLIEAGEVAEEAGENATVDGAVGGRGEGERVGFRFAAVCRRDIGWRAIAREQTKS